MWPFNRKQTSTEKAPAMPPELTDYYQAEKRQQTIVTWLLGFATLVVTIAIAFGLFLGGRWVIHKVKKSPTNQPVATQNPPKPTEAPKDTNKSASTSSGQPSSSAASQPASGGGQVAAGNTGGGAQTSSATTSLPNTGPGETIAVFLIATIAGTALHTISRKRV